MKFFLDRSRGTSFPSCLLAMVREDPGLVVVAAALGPSEVEVLAASDGVLAAALVVAEVVEVVAAATSSEVVLVAAAGVVEVGAAATASATLVLATSEVVELSAAEAGLVLAEAGARLSTAVVVAAAVVVVDELTGSEKGTVSITTSVSEVLGAAPVLVVSVELAAAAELEISVVLEAAAPRTTVLLTVTVTSVVGEDALVLTAVVAAPGVTVT